MTAESARKASIERSTKETSIAVSVDLDGNGKFDITTGVGFFDHMLEQLFPTFAHRHARHGQGRSAYR